VRFKTTIQKMSGKGWIRPVALGGRAISVVLYLVAKSNSGFFVTVRGMKNTSQH